MELPDPVRQRLGNFSLTVFGDSSRTGPESSEAAGLKAAGPPPQTAETVGMPVQLPTDTDAGDAYGFHGSQNNFSQPPKREKSQDRKLIDNEMVSSLPLQMSLYFNSYFFPLWWVSCIVMLHMKYSVLPDYYKFIVITVIVLVTLMEAIRLYLGCMGNLQEKVPELAGFWLLSLLLQLPLILFLLLNEGLRNLPLEKAIHIIFTIFLTFQVISAFLTLKKMVNQLAAHFHLQDFDRLSANSAAMTGRRQPFTEEL